MQPREAPKTHWNRKSGKKPVLSQLMEGKPSSIRRLIIALSIVEDKMMWSKDSNAQKSKEDLLLMIELGLVTRKHTVCPWSLASSTKSSLTQSDIQANLILLGMALEI